jgi:hypothetical protein
MRMAPGRGRDHLLVAADLIHKPPASIRFASIKYASAVTVEPFKFSSRRIGAAYELSETICIVKRLAH